MKLLSRAVASVAVAALAATTLTVGAPIASAKAPRLQTATEAPAFPAVTVTDIKTGKAFKLASLAKGTKPTLVWFWAPH